MAFRGSIITLPVGLQGFCGSKNPSILQPGHLSYCEGVDYDGDVLIKDGGAAKYNSSALSGGILSGIQWCPSPGTYNDIVALDDGTVKKDTGDGTFSVTLKASYSLPTLFPPFFVPAGGEDVGEDRKLFMFTESNQVQVLVGTGSTMADISTPPADWSGSYPIAGVLHDGRLWGFGNSNDPHRIYYSLGDDHQDFTSSGSGNLSIYPGEGEQLVAGLSYKGMLILWKYPRGIYIVDTTDPDIANWQVQRLNNAVGAVSPWCVVQISNDVVYLMNDGTFHLMSATTDFSDLDTSNISHYPNYVDVFMRSDVNLSGLRKAMGLWYPAKSKALFMVSQVGSTMNDLRVMIDFNNQQVGPRYLLSRRDEGIGAWLRRDSTNVERPALGDSDGFVWDLDQEDRNKDGVAYTMELETSENDFSFASQDLGPRTKNGEYIEVAADLVRNTQIDIVPTWDGLQTDSIALALGGTSAAIGSFILDTDALGSSGIAVGRAPLTGQGRRLKLNMKNEILNDDVRIAAVRVGIMQADERLRLP